MSRQTAPPDFDHPWTYAELADYFGVSTRTIDRGRRSGSVRVIRVGNRRLVPGEEVRRLAAEGLTTGGRAAGGR